MSQSKVPQPPTFLHYEVSTVALQDQSPNTKLTCAEGAIHLFQCTAVVSGGDSGKSPTLPLSGKCEVLQRASGMNIRSSVLFFSSVITGKSTLITVYLPLKYCMYLLE